MASFRLTGALMLGAAFLAAAPLGAQTAKPRYGSWGVDEALMDRSVKPGDDFFAFTNGTWVKTFEIPADRSRYGSFTRLTEKALERTRAIVEQAAAVVT